MVQLGSGQKWSAEFDRRQVHVGFVVDEVSLGQASFRVFWFSADSSIPLMHYARSFSYNQYGYNPRTVHVGFMKKVSQRLIFLQVFQFPCASIIPSMHVLIN
jgi:hypothetical protein